MIVSRNISNFCAYSEDSLLVALNKIRANKSRILFSISQSGRLEGVLTDGDIRRWLIEQDEIDLENQINLISNKTFVSLNQNTPPGEIESMFSDAVEYIPLVDDQYHLVAIAHNKQKECIIGNRAIGPGFPVFIIAEIGNNHNGDVSLAKKLVDEAASAGADCAKFQMRNLADLYVNQGNPNDAHQDLGSQYTLDLLSRFNLSKEDLFDIFNYCHERGILPLCTPWDIASVDALVDFGMAAYKIASADLTNHEILSAVIKTGKPIILSTGMSTEAEILETTNFLHGHGTIFSLLHCNSTYPVPFKDINLNYMTRLGKISDGFVGYSGHERGYAIPIAAVAKGAQIIEKHFTLDRGMEGSDHKVSLLPEEFRAMVIAIRQTEESLGNTRDRCLTQGELINRETLAKSLVAKTDIKIGQIIESSMIMIKSPGKGLQPNRKHDLVGRKAKRGIKVGDVFFPGDIYIDQPGPKPFQFRRKWGIPVRYHDYVELKDACSPDLLEFHLSYKDVELDVAKFFTKPLDMDLVVHAPELYSGDHIIDLTSSDEEYRNRSISEIQRTIDTARKLKKYFPKTERPLIITNVGGFSKDGEVSENARKQLYVQLVDSLSKLDCDGVEIIPQTMPPFPWHFGGQQFHNIFVHPKEIVDFCEENSVRVCFDVSHSALACNYFGYSFRDFVRTVGPYSPHLHIADARGVDGEGLQIGEGTMDFAVLADELNDHAPKAGFIPEIWQGHNESGSGFWSALHKLEEWF